MTGPADIQTGENLQRITYPDGRITWVRGIGLHYDVTKSETDNGVRYLEGVKLLGISMGRPSLESSLLWEEAFQMGTQAALRKVDILQEQAYGRGAIDAAVELRKGRGKSDSP